jgi:hypothetical protein
MKDASYGTAVRHFNVMHQAGVCANALIPIGAPSFGTHAVCANCPTVRLLSNAAEHEHASARKRQTSRI